VNLGCNPTFHVISLKPLHLRRGHIHFECTECSEIFCKYIIIHYVMFTYAKASMNCKLCKIMCSLCIYSSCFAMFQGRGYSSWGQPSLRLLILDTAVTMSVGCSLAVFSTLLLACSNVFFVLQEFICTQSTWHWHCGSFLCFFCLMLCASSSYIHMHCTIMFYDAPCEISISFPKENYPVKQFSILSKGYGHYTCTVSHRLLVDCV